MNTTTNVSAVSVNTGVTVVSATAVNVYVSSVETSLLATFQPTNSALLFALAVRVTSELRATLVVLPAVAVSPLRVVSPYLDSVTVTFTPLRAGIVSVLRTWPQTVQLVTFEPSLSSVG